MDHGHSHEHTRAHHHGHCHSHAQNASERALAAALVLTFLFLLVEAAGGLLTGSLALISDAAHMLTDSAALAIALAAIRIARRPADARRTFGYHRFEILAAAFNAVLLTLVGIYILIEAWERLRNPIAVQTLPMLAIACIGLCVNLVAMRVLQAGQGHSLNARGAYLEVWSDMLGSAGVIVGALAIRYLGWRWIDPVIAVAIGLWVLPRTGALLRDSLNVLLEGVPPGIQLAAIEQVFLSHPQVQAVHDLHVWTIGSGKVSLTAHFVLTEDVPADRIVQGVREQLIRQFGIHHTTLQAELAPCDAEMSCRLARLDRAELAPH